MDRVRISLIVVLAFGIPVAATAFFQKPPELCFTSGTTAYRLAPATAPSADYTVAIDNSAEFPDLRIRLVDRVATADFALTDDAGAAADACRTAGALKSVRQVVKGQPADLTISVSRNTPQADLTLYVHSARIDHYDAAALMALVRHVDAESAAALEGPPSTLAAYR